MIGRSKATTSRLRHKLALQQEIRSSDNVGGYSRVWETLCEVWAEILPLTSSAHVIGHEYHAAGQLQSRVSHRIVMRYRAGITPGMRFMFEKRIFAIRALMNVNECKDTLEIAVEELL